MKIALSQLNYTIGSFQSNTDKIVDSILKAKEKGIDLLVFSELAVAGFPAFDLYNNNLFRERSRQAIEIIKANSIGIACIVGGIYESENDLYNAAFFIENGSITQIIKKKYLGTEDWYDEERYFKSGEGYQAIHFQEKNFIVVIGEDINEISNVNSGVDFVLHLSATPFSYTSYSTRITQLSTFCKVAKCPVFQVNQVGGHGEMLFDGRSLIMDVNGDIIDELLAFKEETKYFQVEESINGETPSKVNEVDSEIGLIHDALVMGIKDFFEKQGFKRAVLGLSGGLDSALVAALACKALGAENVLCVLMPSVYSTAHSLKDALDLVDNTGCNHEIIPIKDAVNAFEQLLAPIFQNREADLTEENIQARSRGLVLMAISNKLGHIVLNTSNKSEAAVGYGTLYGDLVGSLSVIGDVYKTQAFELAKYINREREIIPLHTIVKPPSAELRPDQRDIDSLPDYSMLDPILYQYIDMDKSPSDIIALGFDKSIVERIIKLVDNAEFKRFQVPPNLRVSNKAFGRARVMPVVAKM
jgi:NAD+ synthase (glutamine-hydrolysing)